MTNLCVVTGGGSGMGFETARILGKTMKIILVGRTPAKLENAIRQLNQAGIQAEAFPADTGDRASVEKLAAYAASLGKIKAVIHAAGISPHMADGDKILEVNALGTIHINEVFGGVMAENSCILNVASMAAYMIPEERTPKPLYALSLQDEAGFLAGMKQILGSVPEDSRPGMAYSLSKHFVRWYTEKMALRLGNKGIRVVSISPGTFRTPMGILEGEQAAGFAAKGALGRMGEPEEIARMMAFMVSDECSYLTGADVLYDGGSIAAFKAAMETVPMPT